MIKLMHSVIRRCATRLLASNASLQCRCFGQKSQTAFNEQFQPELNLVELDNKWQQIWRARQLKKNTQNLKSCPSPGVKITLQKKYILPMFPYPSGDLHLGHLRVYTISDVLARFYRMNGYNVIHPIGWDAFGLPAENAAIERGIDPKNWTKRNIDRMRAQIIGMNGQWDWNRELATCDPSFYKHTQKLFTLLFKAGLAYRAESSVNYDPVDQTVLANEQVDSNGCSWRSGAKVEKRRLNQWFLKISDYRQQLLDDLEQLKIDKSWPENILAMQKNWLGKSEGARIKFSVIANDLDAGTDVEVFTTRPDTLPQVRYLALATTHPLVLQLAAVDSELQAFLDAVPAMSSDTKVGYILSGVKALNPLAQEQSFLEATRIPLPIYVAPYVLGDYGDGAIMGVPGHDSRDHEFWSTNCPEDPVNYVISKSIDESTIGLSLNTHSSDGHVTDQNRPHTNLTLSEATTKVLDILNDSGRGFKAETWKIRDWLVSRQRYWGTPIPIVHCDSCGSVPVPDDELPVKLPESAGYWDGVKPGNPLEKADDWINTKCPKCGSMAKRDTDTMDTFVDSSWYFMRYLDPHNNDEMFTPELANENLPVDVYVGGVEHAILHLLYARFISKFISNTYLWPSGSKRSGEPFSVILAQGMVHGKTYADPNNGKFLKPFEINLEDPENPIVISTGKTAICSFQKMSKSKYNGVDPSICRDKYGADAMRAHILFQAPVTEVLEWDEKKISGINRWLRRLYNFIYKSRGYLIKARSHEFLDGICPRDIFEGKNQQSKNVKINEGSTNVVATVAIELENMGHQSEQLRKLWRTVQFTISKVTTSLSKTHSLNTVISDLMVLTNTIIEQPVESNRPGEPDGLPSSIHSIIIYWSLESLLKMMAPITPAFAEECWAMLRLKSTASQAINNLTGIPDEDISKSIFSEPFPILDGTMQKLGLNTQPCAVQINGRLRAVIQIPICPEGLTSDEMKEWITNKILAADESQRNSKEASSHPHFKCNSKANKLPLDLNIQHAKKVFVVKKGRMINYVI
ncbi:BgTH12-02250 [Blumeria graminis f. sp. triticale]|uniref:leucine--tRNA ligase n=3 Tax=Blumeria graminis TaxID=34373 RepID=A0A061HNY4_BLUGR|nr:Mitochondrial leucyl-tRNA synthetase [Blumeria graminis f. sp. tritici 96224]CAD6502007.1 BgTH12-02250 [Blumeria graminis f. sp. triticale]VDB85969.1 Bgt-1210 [Blumeria graminis f. sp. tritici]